MPCLLGIDIGTTSTVGILIEPAGRTLGIASRPVTLRSPAPGWAEEDPQEWWANTVAIIRELITGSGVPAREIAAVGIAGMVPALVALDHNGRLVRPSIQQSDGRTSAEVGELRAEFDEADFVRRTGNGINQQLIAAKLRWLARHEPDAFSRIALVFGSYDYIAWRLTGVPALEHNWALESGFLDLTSRNLAPDLVVAGRIGTDRLPPVRASHEIVATVSAAAAAETGLTAGTPVVAGSADHVASAFVAGLVDPGDVLIKFGGAGDVLLATAAPKPDPRLFLDFHLVPGLYLVNGCMATSGAVLNWILETFAPTARAEAERAGLTPHALLDQRASDVPPGAEGLVLLPYFLGEKTPIHDPDARGTLVGLGLHHRLEHVWRAALEAVVFGFRHHFDVFEECGYAPRRVLASDGGATSRIWMQIAADALGYPVELLHGHPGSCLGAAYVAGVGVGLFADWNQMHRFVMPAETVKPDPSRRPEYERFYWAYREIYERLQSVYPLLRVNPGSGRALLEAVRASAAEKAAAGPNAARSQDFLYGDDGLPT